MNTKSAIWNIIFSFFFVALLFSGFSWLMAQGLLISYISLGDFVLIALAVFRLVRLFSYDLITQFLRDGLKNAPKDSLFGTFHSLLSCPWCTGLWFSAFIVFFYFATPLAWPFILVLAIAGIASLIQILANLIGWSAEYKKRSVLAHVETDSKSTCG